MWLGELDVDRREVGVVGERWVWLGRGGWRLGGMCGDGAYGAGR